MLKTIKTTKQMRLDELIKHVWDNDFSMKGFMVFKSDCDKFEVRISSHMLDYVWDKSSKFSSLNRGITFTVEVEEELTEDTVFKCLLEIIDGELVYIRNKKTIKESVKDDTDRFYALVNGKLELVWERDGE